MRKLSLALTLAAGLLFSSSSAFAALVTEDVGTLTKLNPSASYGYAVTTDPNFKLDGSGQGQFRVDFSLGDGSGHTGTSLTAAAVIGTALKTFTFGLYDSANNLLKQVDQTSVFQVGSTTFSAIDYANFLGTGAYYLKLIVTAGNPNQFINGNITIAAVPLPAALPMFGLVLAGLTIVQMRRRAKSGTLFPMA